VIGEHVVILLSRRLGDSDCCMYLMNKSNNRTVSCIVENEGFISENDSRYKIAKLSKEYHIFNSYFVLHNPDNSGPGSMCFDIQTNSPQITIATLNTCCNKWQRAIDQESRSPLNKAGPNYTLDIMLVERNPEERYIVDVDSTFNILPKKWPKGSQNLLNIGM
jgi:hypothetical protein